MGWYISADFNRESGISLLFEKVSKGVRKQAQTVDAELENGALDSNTARRMLQDATGEDWDWRNYSEEEVQDMWKKATWGFKIDPIDGWAFLSAYYFLKTCNTLKLSISVS